VEFCLAIPQDQFLRNGVDRWLIRRAMNSRVPDEILNNRLRGLQSAGKYDQLRLGSDRLKEELSDLALSPLVRHAVDLRRLSDILTQLHDENDMDPGKKSFYGMLAGRGLMSARFLRWAEEAF
jgi:asparagine synthase (glutamine-hydrolysing)